MGTEAELREEIDRGERRERLFYAALPYFLLAVSTLITPLAAASGAAVNLPAVFVLAVATAAWLVWLTTLRGASRTNTALMGIYYTGQLVLSAALVALAPWYGVFAFVGYIHAFLLLQGRWRYIGVAGTSMVMAMSYMGGWGRIADGNGWLWAAISAVTAALAGASFYFTEVTYRHGSMQKTALAELHEANTRLEAALHENAELHSQLLARAHEAGVLDERQRMARDIHDTLAQGLAGILTQLQAAEQTTGDPAAVRRHMTNAMNLARESLTDARRTVHALTPQALAGARLPDAIGDVARRWGETHGIHTVVTTTGDPQPMHPDVEVTLLRAAQEALANVAKHAQATRVGLTLSYMGDLVTLDVRDDGHGFDPAADPRDASSSSGGGFGLAGMRQRVQRLAGRLDIESEPGGGTAISASVPAIPAGAVR